MSYGRAGLTPDFDSAALLYDEVRPGYPDAMFSDIVTLARLPNSARILEIGCGTGQATRSWAERGYRVDCVELGENLASVARRRVARYPDVHIEVANFESWTGPSGMYDLAFSATAFHWVNPEVGFPKLASLIKTDGAVALAWNRQVQDPHGGGACAALGAVYDHVIPPGAIWNLPTINVRDPDPETVQSLSEIAPVTVRTYERTEQYSTAKYLKLLDTYFDHRRLDPAVRARLYSGIAEVLDQQYGGQLIMHYQTILYLAVR